MARQKTVRVRVLTSFNGMYAGDEADLPLTARVQGWVNAGLAEIDGESATGPGGSEPDDAERVEA